MLDFIFILLTILEIILTFILVEKLIKLEKKVTSLIPKLDLIGKIGLELNIKIKQNLLNVNKFVRIITNEKIIQIKKLISFTIDVIQLIILFRTIDFSKGLKGIRGKDIFKIFLPFLSKKILKFLN